MAVLTRPNESYSITMRVEIQNSPGMLGRGGLRDRQGGRRHRRGRHRRVREGNVIRDITVKRPRR